MKSIFLSHSSLDKEFVRELHKILEENGIKSWIDEAEIKIGDSLIKKISEGIAKADYVAIILSPKSMESSWVEKELEMAITQEIENGTKKVLPILIENCEIPSYIAGKKHGDFRTPAKAISGIRELLSILREKPLQNRNEKIQLAQNPKIEHQKFMKIFNEFTEIDEFGNQRISNSSAIETALKRIDYKK